MTKVYISGPVTGLDFEEAFARFSEAEYAILQKNPHVKVVNPMRLAIGKETDWSSAMRECIRAMMDCTHIHMLKGFEKSEGARLEYTIALKLGMGVCNDIYEIHNFDEEGGVA